MSQLSGRQTDRAHLDGRGVGWQLDGVTFSNPSKILNMQSTAAIDLKVDAFPLANRVAVRLLPEGSTLLSTTSGIDAFSAISTSLITVPSGLELQVRALYLRCTAAAGVTQPVQATVVSSSKLIYEDQVLQGLIGTGLAFRFPSGGLAARLTAGESLFFQVTSPALGTSQTLEAQLFGRIYEP